MFDILKPSEIVSELQEALVKYRDDCDALAVGVKVQQMMADMTGCFVVRLTRNVPVDQKHNMTEGREMWAWDEKMLTGDSDVWVMGLGEPVLLRPHEYEIVS